MENNNQKTPEAGKNEASGNLLITKEELEKFKEIAFVEYGVRLTDQQAFDQANALLGLFDSLIKQRLESKRTQVNITNNAPGVGG